MKACRGFVWKDLQEAVTFAIREDFLETAKRSDRPFETWLGGTYIFSYPPGSKLATICLDIDWKAFDDLYLPLFHWTIECPESLYHPGIHKGRLDIRNIQKGIFDMRLRVSWDSPIFSPFVEKNRPMSSEGPLEEFPIQFADALKSIAHFLVFGPYDEHGDFPPAPYSFHRMGSTAIVYFITVDKDAFARASSFFSRAYTLQIPEEDQFLGKGFSKECRETSIIVIRELLQFYKSDLLEDPEWDFIEAFTNVTSHRDWALEERRWADKLAFAIKLNTQDEPKAESSPGQASPENNLSDTANLFKNSEPVFAPDSHEASPEKDGAKLSVIAHSSKNSEPVPAPDPGETSPENDGAKISDAANSSKNSEHVLAPDSHEASPENDDAKL
jgi:hypothetical protein